MNDGKEPIDDIMGIWSCMADQNCEITWRGGGKGVILCFYGIVEVLPNDGSDFAPSMFDLFFF